jgi:CPA2 family monovalent cation:H+ antiporter-2
VGKSLTELSIRPRTGASVIAWTRSQVTQSNPSETVRLQAGDVVTLLGSREQIRRAMVLLNEPNHGTSHPLT